jgi:hypothetical protein
MQTAELLKLAFVKRERCFMVVALLAMMFLALGCPSPGGGTNPPPVTPSTIYADDTQIWCAFDVGDALEIMSSPLVVENPQSDQPFGRIGFVGETPDGLQLLIEPKAKGRNAAGQMVQAQVSIKFSDFVFYPIVGPDEFPEKGEPIPEQWIVQNDTLVNPTNGTIGHGRLIGAGGVGGVGIRLVTCATAVWATGPFAGPWVGLFCLVASSGVTDKAVPVPLANGSKAISMPISGHNLWMATWHVQYEAKLPGFLAASKSASGSFFFNADGAGEVGTHYPNGIEIDNSWDPYDPNDPDCQNCPDTAIVPNVLLKTLAQATILIGNADLTVGQVTTDYSDLVAGLVFAQGPIGGTEVEVGTPVDLVISLGPVVTPFSIEFTAPISGATIDYGVQTTIATKTRGGTSPYSLEYWLYDQSHRIVNNLPAAGVDSFVKTFYTPNTTGQSQVEIWVQATDALGAQTGWISLPVTARKLPPSS